MPRVIAGQGFFVVWPGLHGEDRLDRFLRFQGGVVLIIEGDAVHQSPVEHASFGGLGPGVDVAEVGEDAERDRVGVVGLEDPAVQNITDPDMQKALTEQDLIEQRAVAVLERDLAEHEPWTTALESEPSDERGRDRWRRQARIVAAYRDRFGITAEEPLGSAPGDTHKVDTARADAALRRTRQLSKRSVGRERTDEVVEVRHGRTL